MDWIEASALQCAGMKEFDYTPPLVETPPETQSLPKQDIPASRDTTALVGAAARYMAADLGYSVIKGMTLGLDVVAALKGKKRWKAIRWNPTGEDVEGVSPSLDHHRQEAKMRVQEEIVIWERHKSSK